MQKWEGKPSKIFCMQNNLSNKTSRSKHGSVVYAKGEPLRHREDTGYFASKITLGGGLLEKGSCIK